MSSNSVSLSNCSPANMCEAVLSLCHYLDSAHALSQIEKNCMLIIGAWTLPAVRCHCIVTPS